ncbi:MAG: hypothetical protein JHC26_11805 [Thermofilum sp.]|jgi:hypothetical protein|uniref:hypothetical protein n=1 Tax=Thermofilum sp. TaxID=1961369 RepID=UPI00258F9207|nr:hypothetical protein [Thermofilum sp.]MCI4409768.1 hypothetical protein [Thermofilum sp.]
MGATLHITHIFPLDVAEMMPMSDPKEIKEIVKTDVDNVVVDFSDLDEDECVAIYFSDTATAITICNDGEGFFRIEKRQVLKE